MSAISDKHFAKGFKCLRGILAVYVLRPQPGSLLEKEGSTMKRKLSMSTLLFAGALTGFTGQAGASMQSTPDEGMRGPSQQKSQQQVGSEDAASSSVILGGPEILLGQIEKIDHNGFLVRGDRGQSLKLQVTKDTNIVCSKGSEAKLMTGRQGMQEQAEIGISPTSDDPSTLKDVVGSTDEVAHTGFVVRSSDCTFRPGDLVRIEASHVGTMTTITRLASKTDERASQSRLRKKKS